jgi:putative membrane protein
MNKAKLVLMTATLLAALSAQAQTLAKSDQHMLEQLAQGNMAEIEAGKIALQKSQNTEVKTFAQQMIDDHTKGLQEVQSVAQSKGVTLPAEPDAKHKAMASKLNGLSGDAFDRAYLQQAGVDDHKKTHALVQKVQSSAKDADVKAVAAKLEPTVAQHLTHVTQLNASIKGRGATASGSSGMEGASGSGMVGNNANTGNSGSAGKRPRATPDKASGNTDNPENKQNPTTQPPAPMK